MRVVWIVARLGITYLLAYRLSGPSARASLDARFGVDLSEALQALGGVYVKLGQLLAMRGDLLPPDMLTPLLALLDKPAAEAFDVSLRTIRSALGEKVFARDVDSVDPTPIGSGSFATVYRARLTDDRSVALKVRRYGVEEVVHDDLALLERLARLLDASLLFGRFRLVHFYAQFRAWTLQELDYEVEGRSMTHLGAAMPDDWTLAIPSVDWTLTRPNLLVTEFVGGLWLSDWLAEPDRLTRAERRRAASRLLDGFHQWPSSTRASSTPTPIPATSASTGRGGCS